ncbi:MAG: DUF695 domain-containing protein [Caulobacter sp.]|nr:DUF695 domain-containing protein [Caulobacter sp.]
MTGKPLAERSGMKAQQKWVLAEGELAGKPLLVRARDMEPLEVLPFLLVVDLFYDSVDDTALPGEDTYEVLEQFEAEVLERPSERVRIVLTFVETHDGRVRYYCYASDVDRALEHIDAAAGLFEPEYSAEHDPNWQVYVERMSTLET